jgi:hypothetical protein
MGLVLGSGGRNHAEQTANNTKRIAMLTERMVQQLISPSQAGISAIPSLP